jgi:hypothetical protein
MIKFRNDSDWDEFKDEQIVDWRRIRASLEHEDRLINHRLTWLLSFEALLFAALGIIINSMASYMPNKDVDRFGLYCFALTGFVNIGLIGALYVEKFIRGAENAHKILVKWWGYKYGDKNNLYFIHPPIAGNPYHKVIDSFLRQSRYPLVFALAWLGFNYGVLLHLVKNNFNSNTALKSVVEFLCFYFPAFVVVAWGILYFLQKKEFKNYSDKRLDLINISTPSRDENNIPAVM